MKKNIENSDAATNSAVTLMPVIVRCRKMPGNGTSGALRAQLDQHERADQRERQRDQAERLRRAPAGVVGVDERVDQQRQAGRHRDGAGDVEVARALVAALGQQARGEQRADDGRSAR